MFALIGMVLGAAYGWRQAGKRGGNRADKLQYSAVYGILLFLVGLALTMIADAQGWV